MTILLIALGAAVGAPARYLTDRAIQSRHATVFPWGTFTVNVSRSTSWAGFTLKSRGRGMRMDGSELGRWSQTRWAGRD